MLNRNGCGDLIFFRAWHQAFTGTLEHLGCHFLRSANSLWSHWFRIEVRCFPSDSYSSGIGNHFLGPMLFVAVLPKSIPVANPAFRRPRRTGTVWSFGEDCTPLCNRYAEPCIARDGYMDLSLRH
jgi:hypothetical protein